MNYVAFILLRRLRAPLITLLVVYAFTVLGFTFIPNEAGERPSFFHAFYFTSYMATTIGFGEMPNGFSNAQRMWTLLTLHTTVIAWLYAIGAVFAIFREQSFQRLMARTRFRHQVHRMDHPFYLICGYGKTGSLVVSQLEKRGIHAVVIDIDAERIDALEIDNYSFNIPKICYDASEPEILSDAGLEHPLCIGVLALTDDDHANLSISIAGKLLAPERVVLSRTFTRENAANLASFGTDHIIDPFEIFSDYLSLAIHFPYQYLIYTWLTTPVKPSLESVERNVKGLWVICGYGRFGRALKRRFDRYNVETIVIDPNPRLSQTVGRLVVGLGTEARTLREADIERAAGVVAGTDDDANNLSIIMTAKELNPNLVTVARQNNHFNRPVFDAAHLDMVMQPAYIIAYWIVSLIKTPLLVVFTRQLSEYGEEWAHELLQDLQALLEGDQCEVWSFRVGKKETLALYDAIMLDETVIMEHLLLDPRDRNDPLPCMPLLLRRDGQLLVRPGPEVPLQVGDELLFCGRTKALRLMRWTCRHYNVLRYVVTGTERPQGWIWRKLFSDKPMTITPKSPS